MRYLLKAVLGKNAVQREVRKALRSHSLLHTKRAAALSAADRISEIKGIARVDVYQEKLYMSFKGHRP